MRLFNFFLIKKIYLISISIILTSCSLLKQTNNEYINDFNKDYTEPMNINNNNNIFDNKTRIKIKKLQSINIIYFPLNQYHILVDFFSMLDMHADFLRNNSCCRIRIEGHTDERGTPEYNIALGERRAYSVQNYLQSKGVLSNQMETISYGKEKPVCFNHTEESYSKNRRVVLSY